MTEPWDAESPPPTPTRQPRLNRLGGRLRPAVPVAFGVTAALIAILIYGAFVPGPKPLTQGDVNRAIASAMASATPAPPLSVHAYEVARPSLVLVETQGSGSNGTTDSGLGSGVVIDQNGDILTALHVVADATGIQLTFADGSRSPAEVVTKQAVVSGLDRSFQLPKSQQVLKGLIQIDAAVNPGNSGGPLLNRDGQVVGIVTALINPTQQDVFIGIGLAVPITTAAGAAGLPPY